MRWEKKFLAYMREHQVPIDFYTWHVYTNIIQTPADKATVVRGWLDDAYPSEEFRTMLREKGVKFILSSDAHTADGIDCAFDRFEKAESYERL